MLLFTLLLAVLTTSSAAQETVIVKLMEICRHGARAPLNDQFAFKETSSCCNTTSFLNTWTPEGAGGLTAIGAQQQQLLGDFIRERYGKEPALPLTFNPQQALLLTDTTPRCVYSLYNQSFAIWGPNATLPTYDQVTTRSVFFWDQADNSSTCPIWNANTNVNLVSPATQNLLKAWQPTLNFVCSNSVGLPCTNLTTPSELSWAFTAFDSQMSNYYYKSFNATGAGALLPSWFNQTIFNTLYDAGNRYQYYADYANALNESQPFNEGNRIFFGNFYQLLGQFFGGNASFAQGKPPNNNYQFPVGYTNSTSFIIASGHDSDVAAVLTTLGQAARYNWVDPPFAAMIMFELHQSTTNASALFVKAIYRHWFYNESQPVVDELLPYFCPSTLCPLETFVTHLRDNVYVSDYTAFKTYCSATLTTGTATVTATVTTTSMKPSKAYKSMIGILVFVLSLI